MHVDLTAYALSHTPVLFLDLQSPLDREVKVEEEKGVGPELGGDGNLSHRCIMYEYCALRTLCTVHCT